MTFKPGQQKPPGSGRKKGALDKRQILKRESARSAIELLSQHGFDPITWQSEIANLQHLTALRMALGRLPNEHDTEAQFAEAIASMESRGDKRLVLDWLKAAAEGWNKLTQFRYPKLAQLDVGELPGAPVAEGARVEYTRRIIVRPDGSQYEQPIMKTIEGQVVRRGGNGAG
jgi:hypothetical protein